MYIQLRSAQHEIKFPPHPAVGPLERGLELHFPFEHALVVQRAGVSRELLAAFFFSRSHLKAGRRELYGDIFVDVAGESRGGCIGERIVVCVSGGVMRNILAGKPADSRWGEKMSASRVGRSDFQHVWWWCVDGKGDN